MSIREPSSLASGDRVIRRRLAELAAAEGVVFDSVSCQVSEQHVTVYEYRLLGTDRSISLRARDVVHASDPEKLRRFIEPRLKAVFEDIWWRKSLVIMAGR